MARDSVESVLLAALREYDQERRERLAEQVGIWGPTHDARTSALLEKLDESARALLKHTRHTPNTKQLQSLLNRIDRNIMPAIKAAAGSLLDDVEARRRPRGRPRSWRPTLAKRLRALGLPRAKAREMLSQSAIELYESALMALRPPDSYETIPHRPIQVPMAE